VSQDGTIHNFGQMNPAGEGQGDVPALLRRVADTIEGLGEVDVQDMTFQLEVTDGEDRVGLNVYHHPQPRRR
jgi:hypothetical protein